MRPYLRREAKRRRDAMLPWVLAALTLGILVTSGLMFLIFLIIH